MTEDRGLAALAERLLDASLRLMEHWDAPKGYHPDGDDCVPAFEAATMDARQGYASGRFSPDGGLDAAWAEVEAVLPEGWWMQLDTGAGRIRAMAGEPVWNPAYQRVDVVGDTPVAALRALAAALATPKEEQG